MDASKRNFIKMTKLPYTGQWVCLHLMVAPQDYLYEKEAFSRYIKEGYFALALGQRSSVGLWTRSPQGLDYWQFKHRRIVNRGESVLLG